MKTCEPPRRSVCRQPRAGAKRTLAALVAEFRREKAPEIEEELNFFRTQPSLELAIHHAATATDGDGRCFNHQFRIRRVARPHARAVLAEVSRQLRACRSFHELHTLIGQLLAPVAGLGELYVYDAALRIGAYLKLVPDFVYLHAGTREGAGVLGLGSGRAYLEMQELPPALQTLSADEVESFLCIYKAQL
jgi:hypothetical protein